MRMRSTTALLAALATMAQIAAAASADTARTWPARPVRMVIPFSAGGGTDILGRLLATRLAEAWSQQVVVDNRPGGGSIIGSDIVARATADGHTLLLTANPHSSNPALVKKLPYDTLRDFAPVAMLAQAPLVVVAHPSIGVRTLPELIAAARAKPGELRYGSSGNGGPQHLAAEMFKRAAGVDLLHVPYKGTAPALTDLIAGQVQVGFGSLLPTLPHIGSGRLRALAVTGTRRARPAPDLPTVAESGLGGYEALTWYGLFTRGGTPAPIVMRIHAEVVRALAAADLADRLARDGLEAATGGPAEFGVFVAREIDRLRKLAREANLRTD